MYLIKKRKQEKDHKTLFAQTLNVLHFLIISLIRWKKKENFRIIQPCFWAIRIPIWRVTESNYAAIIKPELDPVSKNVRIPIINQAFFSAKVVAKRELSFLFQPPLGWPLWRRNYFTLTAPASWLLKILTFHNRSQRVTNRFNHWGSLKRKRPIKNWWHRHFLDGC